MPRVQYELLASGDDVKAQQQLEKRLRYNRIKRTLFAFLVVFAIMFAGFKGLKAYIKSTVQWLHKQPCNRTQGNYNTELPSYYLLPSGDQIPSVALGTGAASPGDVGQAVTAALKTGYRHIDGAWTYRNEEEIGKAIKESGIPRDQIWLTSKLWTTFHAPDDVEPALDESLTKLGTEYLDLYIIHWPIAHKKGGKDELDVALTANPYPTWKKLEEMVDKGKVRNIGISNFNIGRVKNLTGNPLKYQPAVNQVELNFWNPQPELIEWARDNKLLLQSFSPLGGSKRAKETLNVPEITEIAKKLNITPAQVIISWHVQRGTVVLPKSVTPSRIEENFKIFALPGDLFDMLETAASAHPPERSSNPSKLWHLDWDIFDKEWPF